MACQYKWMVVIMYSDGEEDILLESRWFDSKKACKKDFDQIILKDGYSLPDSCKSREYIIRRSDPSKKVWIKQ